MNDILEKVEWKSHTEQWDCTTIIGVVHIEKHMDISNETLHHTDNGDKLIDKAKQRILLDLKLELYAGLHDELVKISQRVYKHSLRVHDYMASVATRKTADDILALARSLIKEES